MNSNLSHYLLSSFLASSLAIAQSALAAEANLSKTYTVKPGGQLVLEADRGAVDVITDATGEARIEVQREIKRASEATAQEVFAAHEVTINQDGDKVEIRAKSKTGLSGSVKKAMNEMQVKFIVHIPKLFNVDAKTAAGSITVGDLEGNLKARTSGGSLKFAHIQGPVDGVTAAGSIRLDSATGKVSVKTSGGSIQLGEVTEDTLAETAAGSIRVEAAKANLVAKTSGGSIEAGELSGQAELVTSAGHIRVKLAHRPIKANTSGGSITITEARDTVAANTSAGSVTAGFAAEPSGDCKLTTSGGSIEVRLANAVGFDLDASTSGGHVESDINVAVPEGTKPNRSVLRGKINDGGKSLVLKTSAGNISIRKS